MIIFSKIKTPPEQYPFNKKEQDNRVLIFSVLAEENRFLARAKLVTIREIRESPCFTKYKPESIGELVRLYALSKDCCDTVGLCNDIVEALFDQETAGKRIEELQELGNDLINEAYHTASSMVQSLMDGLPKSVRYAV